MSITAGQTILVTDFVATPSGYTDNGKVAKIDGDGKIPTGFLKFGGTGVDGALAISSGTTTIVMGGVAVFEKNYSSIAITGTGVLSFTGAHANGTKIIIRTQGVGTFSSSASPHLICSSLGGAVSTDGYGPFVKTNMGATAGVSSPPGAGGAVASFQFNSAPFGTMYDRYRDIIPGAGGGKGNGTSGSTPNLSRGGAALIIECAGALTFTTANGISVAGQNGGDASGTRYGGDGGGGGGMALILYNTLAAVVTGTINVAGGIGGLAVSDGGNAPGGGGGGSTINAGTSGTTASSNVKSGGNGAAGLSLIAKNTDFA